ncbi:hypothetical protein BGZ93_007817, partial [Podila epicladia]
MSLQDADLLTADQFIALMPDEMTAKRRFSSEEKPGENSWNATTKRVTAPDPATVLNSLMSTLQVTCGKILDQLATVSAPLSNGSVPSLTSSTTFSTTPPSSNSLSSEVSTTPESNRSDREIAPNSTEEHVKPKLVRVEATSNLENNFGQPEVLSSGESKIGDNSTRRSQPIAINKTKVAHHVGQEHKESPVSTNMFPNFDHQDLMETIWILFDDLEQVVVKMLNILKKYIATDQFAKLLKESDEMGELSQQIFRAEMDRRERWTEQQLDREIESRLGSNHWDMASAMTGGTNIQIRHLRSRDHIRMAPFSQPQNAKAKAEGSSLEGKQDIVRDYLLIVPTAGYRIEGCNDRKKIERAAASLLGHSRDRRSSLFTPSSTTSPPNLLQQTLLTKVVRRSDKDPEEVGGVDSSNTGASELRVSSSSMASQSSSDLVSTQSHFCGGYAMVRVKSLPESKDEWAAVQKRKDIGSGVGVGENIAIGMAPPPNTASGTAAIGIGGGAGGIGPIGAAGVGDMGGRVLPSDLSMMGDYSKEHMGHEAYYYRN